MNSSNGNHSWVEHLVVNLYKSKRTILEMIAYCFDFLHGIQREDIIISTKSANRIYTLWKKIQDEVNESGRTLHDDVTGS